jgi:hypothetical protein
MFGTAAAAPAGVGADSLGITTDDVKVFILQLLGRPEAEIAAAATLGEPY